MNRDLRKGENESWFRDLNERLEHRAAEKAKPDEAFEIVCECAREDCAERIAISFVAYETVRRNVKAFIVVPGHADPTCERLTASLDTYDVVEKVGDAALVAQSENPRDP